VETPVLVDVLAFAPFGVVVTFAPVLDDAFGVLTPVSILVSVVGVALWHGMRVASRGSQLESDLAGVAVFAFTPVLSGVVDVPVCTVPFADVAGVAIWPAALVADDVAPCETPAADVAPMAPPTCAKADVEIARAPHNRAARMMVCFISLPRFVFVADFAR
jgi:hypothetical protein